MNKNLLNSSLGNTDPEITLVNLTFNSTVLCLAVA
jgi:hypothetical protein